MQKKMKWLRSVVVFVLVFCMVLPDVPFSFVKQKKVVAEAAGGSTNSIYMKDSTGRIYKDGEKITEYTFSLEDGLVLWNVYPFVDNIEKTYHTMNTIWSKNESGKNGVPFGHPRETGAEGKDWVYSNVRAVDESSSTETSETLSSFTYTTEFIYDTLAKLYGNGDINNLQPNVPYTVYISEVYKLKIRHYRTLKNGRKVIDYSVLDVYGDFLYTLEDIRNAPKKYSFNWSKETYDAFKYYYDIPLTFYIEGGNINVVCVDMDMYNAELKRSSVEGIVGKTKNIAAEAKITYGGDEYAYQGVYNISTTETCLLDKNGATAAVKLENGQNVTVYFGYKKIPKETKINIVCVIADNPSVVLKERKNIKTTIGSKFTADIDGTLTYRGDDYAYANVYGYNTTGAVDLSQIGDPYNVKIESDGVTFYLGYKKGEGGDKITVPPPPPDNDAVRNSYERFYTTSEGHTIDMITTQSDSRYDSYKTAMSYLYPATGGTYGDPLKTEEALKRTKEYQSGSDSAGNTWNFIADDTKMEAKEVHPYRYNSRYVDSKDGIKTITNLVFPSEIRSHGKTYKVVSIGGGGEYYHQSSSLNSGGAFNSMVYSYGSISGGYFNSNSIPFTEGYATYFNSQTKKVEYWYGVIGNGVIETSSEYSYKSGFYKDERWYKYYVYNTTLKEITIPDTVTEILPYAFCYCQALVKVNGGKNVKTIGKNAFMGVETVAAAINEENILMNDVYWEYYRMMNTQKSRYYKSTKGANCSEEYFYNESKKSTDPDTSVMTTWKSQIQLGTAWKFPQPDQWPTLETMGERAFAFHKNLDDVVLSEKVQNIGKECFGYDMLPEIYVNNPYADIGQHYQTLGTQGFYLPTDNRTLVHAEKTSTAATYVDKYINWYKMNGKREIELDGWMPDIHTDTVVEVNDGEKSRSVIIPIKDRYNFTGYFTEPHGKGTQYYDEDGDCIKEWEEGPEVTKLYAHWEPDSTPPVDPYVPTDDPDVPGSYYALIKKDGARVQIYADDYDPSTGALTDKQPYLTSDLYSGGTKVADGAIPSTEDVAVRAKTGAWMYGVNLVKVTGTKTASVSVTVPYEYMYQKDDGTKETVSGDFSFDFDVPKSYSYWKIVEVDTYKPTGLQVNNTALKGGTLMVPVDWTVGGAPTVPVPVTTSSHSASSPATKYFTVSTAASYTFADASKINMEQIWQDCYNAATYYQMWANEVKVKNDKLVIDGVTILDNTETDRFASGPIMSAEQQIKDKIPFTEYTQTYKSGVELDEFAANATYNSLVQFTYVSGAGASAKYQYVRSGIDPDVIVNDVTIHTPVVCDGIVTVDGVESGRYDSENFYYGKEVDLPIRSLYNPFTVQISNYGLHRVILGYGEKDFTDAKNGDKNIVLTENQVKFDFDVYYDFAKDSFGSNGNVDFTDDKFFPAGSWIKIYGTEPRFYVLGSIDPGRYTIDYRSVAVNCPKDASGNYIYGYSENNANKNIGRYVATDRIYLNIHEDFMGFELNGTNDPNALKEFMNGRRMLTLDKGYYFNFRTQTIGKLFNSPSMKIDIKPTYSFVSEDGKIRTDVDLYYSESIKGKSEYYVKVGSVKDLNNFHSYTNRDELLGIMESLLQYTAGVTGDSSFIGKKTQLFTFGGNIVSDAILRMYPKIEKPLPNMYCRECYAVYCSSEARPCAHTSTPKKIFDLNSNDIKKLCQDWYGGLYIPADTYAVTVDTVAGFCSTCGKTRYVTEGRTTCPDHGTALAGLVPFDFNTYAASNTLTGDEEFFRKDGYIAVNFDIKAVDGAYTRKYTEYDKTVIAKQWMESKVPYRTGDVILYRLDKSIRDAYEIGGSE